MAWAVVGLMSMKIPLSFVNQIRFAMCPTAHEKLEKEQTRHSLSGASLTERGQMLSPRPAQNKRRPRRSSLSGAWKGETRKNAGGAPCWMAYPW